MTQTEKNNLLASHAATLEATAKRLRELIAADAPPAEPPKPEPKPEPPPVIEVPNDLSGYVMKPGEVLDLKGEMFVVSKTILGAEKAQLLNGKLNNQIPFALDSQGRKFGFAAIEIPNGADGMKVERIAAVGTKYNGLIKAWADGVEILRCGGLAGLGWLIQGINADGLKLLKCSTSGLSRGGIYLGSDSTTEPDFCDNVVIDDCELVNGGDEAPLRINGGRNIQISDTICNNLEAIAQKESAQFRGGEISVRACTFLGSVAYGQQANGIPIRAIVTMKKCTVFGYNRMEAGAEVTIEGGEFINRPAWKEYVLKTGGGGILFGLQPARAGLNKAKATVRDVRLDAATISGGIKPVLINCVDPSGKAVG